MPTPRSADEQFATWMDEVDAHLLRLTSQSIGSHLEFEDFAYRDAFDSGQNAAVTAYAALRNAGLFLPKGASK